MALNVKYTEIQTNVIQKLSEEQTEMVSIYNEMTNTVNRILEERYMSGKAANSYVLEFTDPISEIFESLNRNLEDYIHQLEDVCSEFAREDQELSGMLHVES